MDQTSRNVENLEKSWKQLKESLSLKSPPKAQKTNSLSPKSTFSMAKTMVDSQFSFELKKIETEEANNNQGSLQEIHQQNDKCPNGKAEEAKQTHNEEKAKGSSIGSVKLGRANYSPGLQSIKRIKRCSLTNSPSNFRDKLGPKPVLSQYNRNSRSKFKFKSIRNASKGKVHYRTKLRPVKELKRQFTALKLRRAKTQLWERDMLLTKRGSIEDVFDRESVGFLDFLGKIEKTRGVDLTCHKEHLRTQFELIGKKLSHHLLF